MCAEVSHSQVESIADKDQEVLRQMAENIQEIFFWMLDAATRQVIYVSPAYERICGRTSASLFEAPLGWDEIIHPDERPGVLSRLGKLVNTGEYEEEFRIVRPDGSIRWICNRTFPIRDASGNIYRLAGVAQDITARKMAEAALRESEDRYRDLVEHSQDLLCTHTLEGRLLSVNPAPARILGYEVDEILRIPMRNLLAPEFRDQFDDYLVRIRKDGFAEGLMLVLTRTGERRIWEYRNTLRKEGVPSPIVRGMAHDVTERMRAEKAERLSEAKFSAAFRSSPCAMTISTLPDGHLVDVNESFERQTGYARNEVIGHTTLELGMWLDPSERATAIAEMEAKGRLTPREIRFRTKDGVELIGMYSAEIVDVGRERYVLSAGIDITRRKRAEEALLHSEAEYRSLFEGAPYGILQAKLDGGVIRANPALLKMLGYASAADFAGMNFRKDICEPSDEYYEVIDKCSRIGSFGNIELRFKHKMGTHVILRASGRVVRGKRRSQSYVEATLEDITARRAMEARLQEAKKLETIDLIAIGLGQDFRTLLTAILGYSELLLMSTNLANDQRRHVEQIVRAAMAARSTTQHLMTWAHRKPQDPQALDVNNLVQDLGEFLRGLVGQEIRLSIHIGHNLGVVRGDPEVLAQVLIDLVAASRDAMPSGGAITIRTDRLDLFNADSDHVGIEPGHYALLTVQDTGCGMDATTLSRLFDPFFTTKLEGKGTGLGVSSVPLAVDSKCRVEIRVASRTGEGSMVFIYLPAIQNLACETGSNWRPPSLCPGRRRTILVADYDDLVRKLAGEFLAAQGYEVLEAKHKLEVLKVASEHRGPIDLLLADYFVAGMLPGERGSKRLAAIHPETKLLYMTSFVYFWDTSNLRLQPGAEILHKPFLRFELIGKIRRALGETLNIAA